MSMDARAGAKTALSGLAGALLASPASAEAIGQPHPWQMGLQPQVTEIGERINSLHDGLLVIITLITVLRAPSWLGYTSREGQSAIVFLRFAQHGTSPPVPQVP